MALLRLKAAAEVLGVHPVTLRRWADEGRLPVVRPGRERRFRSEALAQFLGQAPKDMPRREALYVRVSGTTGQESSLAAQEEELRASSTGEVVGVFRDRASGLREHRPGLDRVLAMAHAGGISVVRVTHEDRLARFGSAGCASCWRKTGFCWRWPTPRGRQEGQRSCWRTSRPWLPSSPDVCTGSARKRLRGGSSSRLSRRFQEMTDQPGSATSVALTATASCTAFCGQDELSSAALRRAALAERVQWLAEMAAEITRKLVLEHFNDADIKRLGSGVGPDGRPLPAKRYAAMRRLGSTATSEVHCSDRVHRMGEEAAAVGLILAARATALADLNPRGRRLSAARVTSSSRLNPGTSTMDPRRDLTRSASSPDSRSWPPSVRAGETPRSRIAR